MKQKMIEVTIDQIGNPKIEAIGFNGMGCTAATEGIEKALSSGAAKREMKPEAAGTKSHLQGSN